MASRLEKVDLSHLGTLVHNLCVPKLIVRSTILSLVHFLINRRNYFRNRSAELLQNEGLSLSCQAPSIRRAAQLRGFTRFLKNCYIKVELCRQVSSMRWWRRPL